MKIKLGCERCGVEWEVETENEKDGVAFDHFWRLLNICRGGRRYLQVKIKCPKD